MSENSGANLAKISLIPKFNGNIPSNSGIKRDIKRGLRERTVSEKRESGVCIDKLTVKFLGRHRDHDYALNNHNKRPYSTGDT